MTLKKRMMTGLMAVSFIALTSCQETDADKIGDAQLCLDKATAATAEACLSKIEGINTPQANILRCSAGFLSEGFDDVARLVDSFEQLEDGGDGTIGLLSVLAFRSKTDGDTNRAFAVSTNTYCQNSKQKGLSLLGTMAMSATTLASIAIPGLTIGTNISPAQIDAAIQSLQNATPAETAEMLKDIGTAVSATYQVACSTGAQANQDLCGELESAISDNSVDINDPQSIANAILAIWKQ